MHQKTFLKMTGGRMHAPHPTPVSAPGQWLQKPSKESGIFQSLDIISILFLFTKRQSQKGRGAWDNGPAPKYAP